MIRALYFENEKLIHTNLPQEEFSKALSNPQGLLWVDFQGEPPETSEPILLNTFKFHPLAVEDAVHQTHVPKVDDWEKYLYIALIAMSYTGESGDLETIELDAFLGETYLVTHHDLPIPALERAWQTCQKDERHRKSGADHFLYLLTEELTVDFMHTVEEVDEEIEGLEDEVFGKPDRETVQRVFTLKRSTIQLRRSLSPMREVLNKLARDDYSVIDSKDRIYFRDVYDHFVRLHDIAESLRDLVGGVLDTYLSVVNNRMNEVMKVLATITTMFMPISFLAGFFGMNFFQPVAIPLKPWTSNLAFIITIIIFIVTPAGMYLWMRRKGWT
jgi:magnesium transporter